MKTKKTHSSNRGPRPKITDMFSMLSVDEYCSLLRTAMIRCQHGSTVQESTFPKRHIAIQTAMFEQLDNGVSITLSPIASECLRQHFKHVKQQDIIADLKIDPYTFRAYINGFLSYMCLPLVRGYLRVTYPDVHTLLTDLVPVSDGINMFIDRSPTSILSLSCPQLHKFITKCS